MDARLRDLVSGVVAVSNKDGFPLESCPPQGSVNIEFGTGRQTSMMANMDEYEQARKAIAGRRASVSSSTTPAQAFRYYLQVAHNVMVDEATAGAILADAKSA